MSNLRNLDCSGTQLQSLPHSRPGRNLKPERTHHCIICGTCVSHTTVSFVHWDGIDEKSFLFMCLWYQCFFLAQVVHLRAMTQSDCVLIFLVLKPLRAQMHSEDGPPLPVVQRLCGPLQPSLLLPVHVVHLVGVCLCLCRRLHAVHPAQGTAECESPFPPLCSD